MPYEVALKEKYFLDAPWSQNILDNGVGLLILVPNPLEGVIVIGEEAFFFKATPIRQSIDKFMRMVLDIYSMTIMKKKGLLVSRENF